MKKMGKILLISALALGSTTLTGCGVESIVSAAGGGGGGGGGFGLGNIQKLLGGFLKFPNVGIGNIGNGNTVNVGPFGPSGPDIIEDPLPVDASTSITDSTVGGYPPGVVESAPLAPVGGGWDTGTYEPGTEFEPVDTSSVGEA